MIRHQSSDRHASIRPDPAHVYVRPGLYPVTLVVEDGVGRATLTQHLTVDGDALDRPSLAVEAPNAPSFRPRPSPGAPRAAAPGDRNGTETLVVSR